MADAGRNILALDIAFGPAAACLMRCDGRVFTAGGDSNRPHSQSIVPILQSLVDEAGIDWRELDMLACGVGPGSFTGLRMAAATLAGINASLDLPLIEISSLGISAAQVEEGTPLYVIEDARSGLAYVGRYKGVQALIDDGCLAWDEVRSMGTANYTAHRASPTHLPGWTCVPASVPRPLAMSRLVAAHAEGLDDTTKLPRLARPIYLMASQAERHARTN